MSPSPQECHGVEGQEEAGVDGVSDGEGNHEDGGGVAA